MAYDQVKLVVFDIDGTLTNTNQVDGECFKRTFSKLHRIDNLSTDWGAYLHSTDSGIIDQIFRERLGRSPSSSDLSDFISFFVGELEREYLKNIRAFAPMDGVPDILDALQAQGWTWAIATGAWKKSAEFKLNKGAISVDGRSFAYAEDGFARSQIIKTAISRAEELSGNKEFDRIVYVGDGYWDAKAAAELNLPFVHIATATKLPHRLSHYRDLPLVFKMLDSASAPL